MNYAHRINVKVDQVPRVTQIKLSERNAVYRGTLVIVISNLLTNNQILFISILNIVFCCLSLLLVSPLYDTERTVMKVHKNKTCYFNNSQMKAYITRRHK